MTVGIWQIALVLLIVLLLFGAGKLPRVMGDVAKGIRGFRTELRGTDTDRPAVPSAAGNGRA